MPLQTSRRKAEAPLSAGHKTVEVGNDQMALFAENPTSLESRPAISSQRGLDASRVVRPQPDFGGSFQRRNDLPAISQEVFEGESEQMSAMTSMSQSSFPQTQSQNLLGPSQDDQLYRLQKWQAEQAIPTFKSPAICDGTEKLQQLETSLTKAFVAQTREQMHQQKDLLAHLLSPIEKSIVEVKAELEIGHESQQMHLVAIKELDKSITSMTDLVTTLYQQSFGNIAANEKARMAKINESNAVNTALSELQAKMESVEGDVKSCSSLVAQVVREDSKKHEALLSAFTNSSCICRKDTRHAKYVSASDALPRKRRRSSYRQIMAEGCFASPTLAHLGARPNNTGDGPWADFKISEMEDEGLVIALQRIERLRSKRRRYNADGISNAAPNTRCYPQR